MKATVTSAIATAIITAIVEGVGRILWQSSLLLSFLSWSWSKTKDICLTLFTPVELPFFVVALLMIMSGTLALVVIRQFKKEKIQLTYRDYTEDQFDGMVWRWDYRFDGSIHNPWCYCPHCDGVLVYAEDYDWEKSKDFTRFICENCNNAERGRIDGNKIYVISRITRLIDRKIRSEEYKTVLQRQEQTTQKL